MNALQSLTSAVSPTDTQRNAEISARQAKHDAFRAHAREKAQEFESVFLQTFVEQMFAGIKTEGAFTGGSAEGIYKSMMSEEYAKTISRNGGIGLADHMYAEILKAQHIEP